MGPHAKPLHNKMEKNIYILIEARITPTDRFGQIQMQSI